MLMCACVLGKRTGLWQFSDTVHNVWTKIQSSSKKPWAKDSLKCCVTSLPAGLLDLLTHAVELRVQFRGDHGVCSILQTAGPVADDFICEQAQWKMVRPQAMKNSFGRMKKEQCCWRLTARFLGIKAAQLIE